MHFYWLIDPAGSSGVDVDLKGRFSTLEPREHADRLVSQLQHHQLKDQQVRLQCRDLADCDSTGVAWLMYVQDAVRQSGGCVELRDPPPRLSGLLDFFGVSNVFTIVVAG